MKRVFKLFLILFILLALAAGFFFIRAAIHTYEPDSYGDYEFDPDAPFVLSQFDGTALYLDSDAESLKVLQIADPQMKFGFMTQDTKTMDLIDRAITAEQPDLCVVTGDLTLSVFTYDAYRYFADFMEEREQYWTITFGNHDSDFDCSKYTLATLLSEYEYCLFSPGPSNVKGASNFPINVYKAGSTVPDYALILMDSNMYPSGESGDLATWAYDWMSEEQIEWYRWVILGLQGVNAEIQTSLFYHIPTVEMAEMYYANELAEEREIPSEIDTSVFYDVSDVRGNICEEGKTSDVLVDKGYEVGIYYQGKNTGLFDAARELGSTKAMFFGHDHLNTLKGYYGGIFLGYGLCCGYHTYPYFQSANFLTDLLGLSNSPTYIRDLWIAEDGTAMQKGVTVIEISLSDLSYGDLTVRDRFDDYYAK